MDQMRPDRNSAASADNITERETVTDTTTSVDTTEIKTVVANKNKGSTSDKQNKEKSQQLITEDQTPDSYNRWFIIQSSDKDKPLAKLSPFIIDKALKATLGELKTITRL